MKTMIGDDESKMQQGLARNIIRVILGTALILLVPLLAMQFTGEVDWDVFDFAVAGALLAGTGLTYVLVARKLDTSRHRAIVGVTLAIALFLVWVELAVGIVGD